MKIAVAGKGGVGKTHIAACLSRMFARSGCDVYAIDADPGGGLGWALGFSKDALSRLKPIVDMREFLDAGQGDGALYFSARRFGGVSGSFSVDSGKLHFLRMTNIKYKIDNGNPFCYCEERDFLRTLIDSMLLNDSDVVIIDMSAGIEHLSRGTIKSADLLLVITEPTRASVDTTRLIRSLGAELGIHRIKIAANKIRSEKDEILVRASFHRDELLGVVRMSDTVSDMALGINQNSRLPLTRDLTDLFLNITSACNISENQQAMDN